jgi:hypothetical protein
MRINIKYKYPRTPHLPWSPGRTSDDKTLDNVDHFSGQGLIATIKYDGENTTMYSDHIHARSLDSKNHESRHWVKAFHAGIKHLIPDGWRICGENLYAKHSIAYVGLQSYFYGFSVWDERNVCLSYTDTKDIFDDLGIVSVLSFASGNLEMIDKQFHEHFTEKCEGYVVRLAGEFRYEDFGRSVAKYVRAGHVQTDVHWMYQEIVPNKLL